MRALGVLGFAYLALSSLPAIADEFPYTAYVVADDVYVRSGPGRSYYPTQKLHEGDTVEIYRHDPGGWYAIRPPQESFSWVSGRHLKPTAEGMGVVTDDAVVARVGSVFSNVRDVIQVRLNLNEPVAILGQHDTGSQTWYKIAAPAGEFRWISSTYLDREPPLDGVSRPRRRPATPLSQSDAEAAAEGEAGEAAVYLPEQEAVVLDEPLEATEPAEFATDERTRPIQNRLIRQIEAEQAAYDEQDEAARPVAHEEPDRREVVYLAREESRRDLRVERDVAVRATRTSRSPRSAAAAPASFETAVEALELELASMVAEEPTLWVFGELKREATALLADATTAVERGAVRRVQHQIARLEDIQQRYQQIGAVMDETDRRNAALDARAGSSLLGDDLDGRGMLRPVVSRRSDAPRYALVDDRGEVLHFLTPGPGINLQAYLGQYIGVIGTRGYMPELKKPHVMVRTIYPLGER